MILIFFYYQFLVLSEISIGSNACTCDESTGFCDADFTSKSLTKQILPECDNSKPFQTSGKLSEWLLQEIFCIRKRPDYSTKNSISNKEPPNFPTPTPLPDGDNTTGYKYGSTIRNTLNKTFYIPAPFLASADCHMDIRPLEFLVPVNSLMCYYNTSNQTIVDDIYQLLHGSIKDTVLNINSESCSNDNNLTKSVSYNIIYEGNTTIQLNTTIECYQEVLDGMAPLQVDAHFYNKSNSESFSNKMKSGEAGYSHGQPLIALRENSYKPEPFPIPFGSDCSNNSEISYTPLLFGYDTIGGCSENGEDKDHILDVIKEYKSVSIMGQATSGYQRDWIAINGMENIDNCSNLELKIAYEYVGNEQNPQNKIYSANYVCKSQTNYQYFLFMVNFLRSSDDSTKSFIPKPKGLPDDTFAPII